MIDRDATRFEVVSALRIALADPHRVLALIIASTDEADAVASLAAAYGVSEAGARAMLDTAPRHLNGSTRARIEEEYRALRARLGLPE